MPFDPRSFIITSAFLGILCAFMLFVMRRGFPREIRGIGHWGCACLIIVAAAFLFAFQGYLSPLLSSLTANIALVTGVMLMYASLRRFDGKPFDYRRMGASLLALSAVLAWVTLVRDDYRLRVIIITGVNTLLFASCACALLRMQERTMVECGTAAVFSGTALISLIRLFAAFGQPASLTASTDLSVLQGVYLATFSFSLLALSLCFMLMTHRRLQVRLEYLASHDSLTNAYTRRAFLDLLARELHQSARRASPVSLLMIDIDNFKAINDQYGHPTGDRVIIDFVERAQQALRGHDVVGRYGGEEFTILLPGTDKKEAMLVADRMRAVIDNKSGEGLPRYTVSIGVTDSGADRKEVAALLGKADQALYTAKKSGKNRVALAA